MGLPNEPTILQKSARHIIAGGSAGMLNYGAIYNCFAIISRMKQADFSIFIYTRRPGRGLYYATTGCCKDTVSYYDIAPCTI